ncbi:copper resistance protein CopC (plasmid) [Rhizobium sp. CC1099]|uniref:copper resistance CopC family protein n=1 Tax=Rhizobium sp. CC1099 TaxID=3039160 RepID=UPI0024B24B0C|nr:copper resistance protein CopC [Rhizobium sp. CC1099]WFU91402.1 copper resistance protein CopC [Rhizobium sp. CC1099]
MHHKTIITCVIAAACICIPTAGYANLDPAVSKFVVPGRPAADLTLTFRKQVKLERSAFELVDEHNVRIPIDNVVINAAGRDVVVSLDRGLKPGSYKVQWRACYEDGQVEQGTYNFEVRH